MSFSNTWQGVYAAAEKAGAKYPELVAAQWALESGWGKFTSGKHNYFGLKGDGALVETQEYVNGKPITIKDRFLNFDSLEDCVAHLVKLWYKDYKTYKGVNHASTATAAARQLQTEGYATNPNYAEKLIRLMKDNKDLCKPAAIPTVEKPAAKSKPVAKRAAFQIRARQVTFLKKSEADASTLSDTEKVAVPQGHSYGVVTLREIPASAHAEVVLGGGAGTWHIYMPHWDFPKAQPATPKAGINWSKWDCPITPNLTVGEVLQYDPRRIPPPGSSIPSRILVAAEQFQRIRDAWGHPIGVTSWYRPEPVNSEVGGVPGSQHTLGTAFDIYPADRPIQALYDWLRLRWTGALGDGRRRGFLHLDLRGNGVFVPGAGATPWTIWTY